MKNERKDKWSEERKMERKKEGAQSNDGLVRDEGSEYRRSVRKGRVNKIRESYWNKIVKTNGEDKGKSGR